MDTFEVISTIVLFLTVVAMIWQNAIAQKSFRSANLMALFRILEEDEFTQYLEEIMITMKDIPADAIVEYLKENKEKQANVRYVLDRFELVGVLLKDNFTNISTVLNFWYAPFIEVHSILAPFIREYCRSIDPNAWSNYLWLYEQAEKHKKRGD
jgi:hypothetical protein